MPRGTVVRVGEAVGEFRRVFLPIGVIGYVSKRFSTGVDKGLIKTTGDGGSFRYRPTPPRRAEQPVTRLAKGTELKYLGQVGDWWKVRLVTDSAYLPIKDILTVVGTQPGGPFPVFTVQEPGYGSSLLDDLDPRPDARLPRFARWRRGLWRIVPGPLGQGAEDRHA